MADLPNLDEVTGEELSDEQLRGVVAQIDLDIVNLLRDGKLSALKYGIGGPEGRTMDRSANLKALLAARQYYDSILRQRPGWETSQYAEPE
ncbi:MAG: hypothetical protein CMJ46_04935 [Planctomyces sp.]|nr:hypothetical protein [Planctomyces sp.]